MGPRMTWYIGCGGPHATLAGVGIGHDSRRLR